MCILILRRVISRSISGRRNYDYSSSFFFLFSTYSMIFFCGATENQRECVSLANGRSSLTGVRCEWIVYIGFNSRVYPMWRH